MQSLAIVYNASHDGSRFIYIISLSAWASLWLRNKFLLQYQEYVTLAWVSLMCFLLEQQQIKQKLIRQLVNYYTNSASILTLQRRH